VFLLALQHGDVQAVTGVDQRLQALAEHILIEDCFRPLALVIFKKPNGLFIADLFVNTEILIHFHDFVIPCCS
jgi:hypothetical protein